MYNTPFYIPNPKPSRNSTPLDQPPYLASPLVNNERFKKINIDASSVHKISPRRNMIFIPNSSRKLEKINGPLENPFAINQTDKHRHSQIIRNYESGCNIDFMESFFLFQITSGIKDHVVWYFSQMHIYNFIGKKLKSIIKINEIQMVSAYHKDNPNQFTLFIIGNIKLNFESNEKYKILDKLSKCYLEITHCRIFINGGEFNFIHSFKKPYSFKPLPILNRTDPKPLYISNENKNTLNAPNHELKTQVPPKISEFPSKTSKNSQNGLEINTKLSKNEFHRKMNDISNKFVPKFIRENNSHTKNNQFDTETPSFHPNPPEGETKSDQLTNPTKSQKKQKRRNRNKRLNSSVRYVYQWRNSMGFKWQINNFQREKKKENAIHLCEKGDEKKAKNQHLLKAFLIKKIRDKCDYLRTPIIFYSGGLIDDRKKGPSILVKRSTRLETAAIQKNEENDLENDLNVKDNDFANFVKYSSGVSLKILQRHGFKNRLGAEEDGRVNPILPKHVNSRCLRDFFPEQNDQMELEMSSDDEIKPEMTWRRSDSNDENKETTVEESDSNEGAGQFSCDEKFYKATTNVPNNDEGIECIPSVDFGDTISNDTKENNFIIKENSNKMSEEQRLKIEKCVDESVTEIEKELETMKIIEESKRSAIPLEKSDCLALNPAECYTSNYEEELTEESVTSGSNEFKESEDEFAHKEMEPDPFDLYNAEYSINVECDSDPLKDIYRERKARIPLDYNRVYGEEYILTKDFRYKDQPIPRQLDPKLQNEMDQKSQFRILQRPHGKESKGVMCLRGNDKWAERVKEIRRKRGEKRG